MNTKPHFEKINDIPTLFIKERPFIAFAGELHNSSASSENYMNEYVWEYVNRMNINTVVAPVYWELIEPEESKFNFDSVTQLIDQARKNQKKLILLWFGLWKNGVSTYIPNWMKIDRESYPFVEKKSGERIYSVTPLCKKAVKKDALAFEELLQSIREYDSIDQTVIMIQIENEVGALETDFDYGDISNQLFEESLPSDIAEKNQTEETWINQFGDEAKEYFMAYHYAKAIDYIAERGKNKYDIPMFVNVWLEKYPARPGEYPTGGPTAKMAPFWKKIAKNIDAIGPDVYVPNFTEVCEQYLGFQDNLLIPETRQDINTVANLLYGISKYNINCFSPFGIEDFMKETIEKNNKTLTVLAIDASAFDCSGTGEKLSKAYSILTNMSEIIVEYRGTDKMFPFLKEKESDRGTLLNLSNCEAKVSYQNFNPETIISSGFVVETNEFEFYVVGINIDIQLRSKNGDDYQVGILSFEEGNFEDGLWKRGRILNGDERYNIQIGNDVQVLRISYHNY